MQQTTPCYIPAEVPQGTELVTAEFDMNFAKLAELKSQYANLVIGDNKTYQGVKEARATMREIRYGLQNTLKEANGQLKEKIKANNTEAERLIKLVSEVEDPLHAEIQRWEKIKADEKAERERKEQERVSRITNMISWMSSLPTDVVGKDSQYVESIKANLVDFDVTETEFAEYTNNALLMKQSALEKIDIILKERKAYEESERERAEMKAKLDAQAEKEALEQRTLHLIGVFKDMVIQAATKRSGEITSDIEDCLQFKLDGTDEESDRRVDAARREAIESLNVIRSKQKITEQVQHDKEEAQRQAQEARQREEDRLREEAEAKARAEQEELERQRLEALRPDQDRLISFLSNCIDSIPVMNTEAGAILAKHVLTDLDKLRSELAG